MSKASATFSGGLVVAGAVGLFLAINGFLAQFGSTGGGADSGAANVQVNAQPTQNVTPATPEPAPANVEAQPAPAGPPKVIDVVIDDRAYFVREDVNGMVTERPIELDALIELAKTATGNEDGFRIRVFRKGSSRASAEDELEKRLKEAGFAEGSVHWPETPVEASP